jgi:hypothetical protein
MYSDLRLTLKHAYTHLNSIKMTTNFQSPNLIRLIRPPLLKFLHIMYIPSPRADILASRRVFLGGI